MPGASAIEDAWIRGRLGETGYLAGADAETAACDALIVPVVTGHADLTIVDKMIALALSAIGGGWPGHATGGGTSDSGSDGRSSGSRWADDGDQGDTGSAGDADSESNGRNSAGSGGDTGSAA